MHLLRIASILGFTAAALAGGAGCGRLSSDVEVKGPKFSEMTAAEHRRAAELERAAARSEAARARDDLGPGTPGEGYESPVFTDRWGIWDPYWDPLEPEYYTIDPRPHVGGEGHADNAKEHRERAEAHDQAAARLEAQGQPYRPRRY
jgi:hypothetical protein